MNLQSCSSCGVVVDFDNMQQIETTTEEEYNKQQKIKGYYNLKYSCGANGFYCPVCKEWVFLN